MVWQELAAAFINGVLVLVIVQYLKTSGMSWLKTNAPWLLPIIALSAGLVLTAAAASISGYLGYPIDFSPIIAILTGSLAITTFDVWHGAGKVLGV